MITSFHFHLYSTEVILSSIKLFLRLRETYEIYLLCIKYMLSTLTIYVDILTYINTLHTLYILEYKYICILTYCSGQCRTWHSVQAILDFVKMPVTKYPLYIRSRIFWDSLLAKHTLYILECNFAFSGLSILLLLICSESQRNRTIFYAKLPSFLFFFLSCNSVKSYNCKQAIIISVSLLTNLVSTNE